MQDSGVGGSYVLQTMAGVVKNSNYFFTVTIFLKILSHKS